MCVCVCVCVVLAFLKMRGVTHTFTGATDNGHIILPLCFIRLYSTIACNKRDTPIP